MATEQTRNILDHTRDFHQRISQYFHHLADSTQRQRVKLLLDYMSEHERRLADCVRDYEEAASASIMNTWIQSSSCTDAAKLLDDFQLKPDQPIEDVIELGLRISECALEVYRHLADRAEPESVRQVFLNLLALELESQKQFAQNAGRLADL